MQSTARRADTVLGLGTCLSVVVAAALWIQLRERRRVLALAVSLEESRQLLSRASEIQARISRDLHDGTVQSLFAIELGLGRVARRLEGSREAQMIQDVLHEMDAMIKDLRGFLVELDPEISPSQLASTALTILADRLRKATGREVEFTFQPGSDSGLNQEKVVHLIQTAREGASNAIRHGGATRIHIRLTRDEQFIRLLVTDNGAGFRVGEDAFRVGGGLTNMRLRAEKMSGSVRIESRTGGPTHLYFEFKNDE
jgi:signal transduction histidine kinase